METIVHLSMAELEAGVDHIRQAPKDQGELRMIVCRPQDDDREALQEAELSLAEGLVGDNWMMPAAGKCLMDRPIPKHKLLS